MTTYRHLSRLQQHRAALQKLWERKAERKQTLTNLKASILANGMIESAAPAWMRQSVERVLRRG